MTEDKKCFRCGSTQLVSGRVQSTGRMNFRPDKVNFFAPRTADLSITGMMCLDCGAIELIGDINKAKSLVKHAKVES